GDSALKARVIARLAEATRFSDLSRERELSREAVETARRSGDNTALAQALYSRSISLGSPWTVQERLEAASELIAAAEQANNRNLQMLGYRIRTSVFGELGRMAELADDAVAYAKIAAESRQPLYIWWTSMYAGMRALMDADLEKAETIMREAWNLGTAAHDPNAEIVLIPPRFLLARESGNFDGIRDHFDVLVRKGVSDFIIWRGSVFYFQLLTGDFSAVERSLPTIVAHIETEERDWGWCWWAYEVAEILTHLGESEQARQLYEKVLPFADQVATPGYSTACYGSNHHTLGLLSRTMGDLDVSRDHFARAVKVNAAMSAPGLVARSKYELARTLVASKTDGARHEALSLLGESLDICRERKLGGLVDKVLDLKLQVQGVDRSDVQTSIHAVADEVAKEQPDLGGAASPDGTITIVFSDIEGSTAMNERLGDQRWVELLRGHDAIVRNETAAAGGVIVKSRGDGFMLAFSSARQALRCAIGIQHGFAKHNQNAETPIRVRIGVHTGEVVKEAGDFYGRHVNLAARIADQADGDEILVSELTSQLLAGSQEFRFADSRESELKGFPGRHRMIRVDWRD
ncbi:MAG TPA: adenylate/guanylate cyclase domain-containing protein, partial [Actinomycetota bacterium]|nr:adenylate/guanylate cyclase domain-containing protein [Actinomycetota bacterium]